MVLIRPTLEELKNRHENDIKSSLNITQFLPNSFLKALSNATAGAISGLYGFLVNLSKIALPDQATGDFLNSWATVYGVSRLAGSFSNGNVTFTGINGTSIPANTLIVGTNDIIYQTQALATIATGTATVAVQALTPGALGNLLAGVTLSILNPIAGIDTTVTVAAGGLTAGADQETDQQLRDRIIQRIQAPPHGGNFEDYENWALSIAGIGKAWVLPLINGAGSVGIYVGTNDDDNLAPDAGKIAEVLNYISAPNRKPVTAAVTVNAPTIISQDFELRITPDTAETRATVEASLKDLINRTRKPGVLVGNTVEGWTLLLSQIREAVSVAAGEIDNEVIDPVADIEYDIGEVPELGVITWST
jgi:uncharacterized phage protein gp47/JayE